MHDDDLAKFSVGDEVSIYGGSAIYIVKSRKLNDDPQWPMWIYDCFLKDDGIESTKALPEQVLRAIP